LLHCGPELMTRQALKSYGILLLPQNWWARTCLFI